MAGTISQGPGDITVGGQCNGLRYRSQVVICYSISMPTVNGRLMSFLRLVNFPVCFVSKDNHLESLVGEHLIYQRRYLLICFGLNVTQSQLKLA